CRRAVRHSTRARSGSGSGSAGPGHPRRRRYLPRRLGGLAGPAGAGRWGAGRRAAGCCAGGRPPGGPDRAPQLPGRSATGGPVMSLPCTTAELVDGASELARGPRRILGIVGAPGAGKSTLAELLVAELDGAAVCVPMDGFHLEDSLLRRLGRRGRKGAIDTFDDAGYAALMQRLAAQPGSVPLQSGSSSSQPGSASSPSGSVSSPPVSLSPLLVPYRRYLGLLRRWKSQTWLAMACTTAAVRVRRCTPPGSTGTPKTPWAVRCRSFRTCRW